MSNEKEVISTKTLSVDGDLINSLFQFNVDELKLGDTIELRILRNKEKKLDWSKIPVDTLVQVKDVKGDCTYHYFKGLSSSSPPAFPTYLDLGNVPCNINRDSRYIVKKAICELAPVEMQPWHVWWGGDCPLPDGVLVEYLLRCGMKGTSSCEDLLWVHSDKTVVAEANIIAYRIVGLAEGWEY